MGRCRFGDVHLCASLAHRATSLLTDFLRLAFPIFSPFLKFRIDSFVRLIGERRALAGTRSLQAACSEDRKYPHGKLPLPGCSSLPCPLSLVPLLTVPSLSSHPHIASPRVCIGITDASHESMGKPSNVTSSRGVAGRDATPWSQTPKLWICTGLIQALCPSRLWTRPVE